MMMPSCDVISRRMSESYDRKLSVRERLSIRIHTLGCILCERYRRQLLIVHNLLQQYSTLSKDVKSDSVLSSDAKVHIKTHLHESTD